MGGAVDRQREAVGPLYHQVDLLFTDTLIEFHQRGQLGLDDLIRVVEGGLHSDDTLCCLDAV